MRQLLLLIVRHRPAVDALFTFVACRPSCIQVRMQYSAVAIGRRYCSMCEVFVQYSAAANEPCNVHNTHSLCRPTQIAKKRNVPPTHYSWPPGHMASGILVRLSDSCQIYPNYFKTRPCSIIWYWPTCQECGRTGLRKLRGRQNPTKGFLCIFDVVILCFSATGGSLSTNSLWCLRVSKFDIHRQSPLYCDRWV